MSFAHLGVVGGGAWGTALAIVAAANGRVTLWAREAEVVEAINGERENSLFLAGVDLPAPVGATGALADLAGCDALVIAAPAQHLRAVLGEAAAAKRPLLLCAKGIEAGTHALMSEVAAAVAPGAPLAILSGPTFAIEVARGLPTAVTLACADRALGEALARRLATPAFRPYSTGDLIGAQVGGAVKNVLAIACGVVAGLELGENARAAVISRGFAEMTRYGLARGARAATLAGLSGLGDLVLTCSSAQSRNFTLGVAIGRGAPPPGGRAVAEGAQTAPALAASARALGVDMPITDAVAELVAGAARPAAVLTRLLNRPLREEG